MRTRVRNLGCSLVLVAAVGGCAFDTSGLPARDSGANDPDGPMPIPDARVVDADRTPDAQPSGYFKRITIQGGQVAGALQDFPVYIVLTADGDLSARAAADGTDLHFTDATGTVTLDHEIQRWDPDAGDLEAWVRVPGLAAGADTILQLRYGGGTPVAQDPAGVWSNGFVAVWHMEQGPGSAESIRESLGQHHGTASGSMAAGDLVAGILGRGLQFQGGSDEVTFTNPLLGASTHTISAWVDQRVAPSNDALVVLGTGACNQARWLHSRYTDGPLAAGFYCDDFIDTSTDLQGDGPVLLHWTYDAQDDSRIYVDGELAEGPHSHFGNQFTIGGTGRIGNAPGEFGSNMGLNAVADEVRIADVARPAAWIDTEFANQSSPATFYTVGPEQFLP